MPDWLEVAVRTLFAVSVLFVITKILGKRQVTQLSLFEYITGITIGNLAAAISLEVDSPWYIGVTSLTVWVAVSLFIMFVQIKSKTLRNLIDGKMTVLIKNGKINEKNLRSEKLALDELLGQLRKKNVFRISDVEYACIEPNGAFSVLLKKEHLHLIAKTLGVDILPESEPYNVIMDGAILDQPLKDSGFTKERLNEELKKRNVKVEDVFFGQIDSNQEIHLDLHDHVIEDTLSKEDNLTLVLKRCQGELKKIVEESSVRNKQYEELLQRVNSLLKREET
jgi:uncharacterized membrane protein YcaP (DUF421 family)